MYVVIEGGDKSGKGYFLNCLQEAFNKDLHPYEYVLNVDEYQIGFDDDPPEELIQNAQAIFMSEPSYALEGALIREYLIKEPPKGYSSPPVSYIAEMFARDRARFLPVVVHTARENGIPILCSRNVFSSVLYQPLDAKFRSGPQRRREDLSREDIVRIPGNAYALENFLPDLVINCTVSDETRRERRDGDDNPDDAIYERNDFSEAIAKMYNEELPALCKQYGVAHELISLEGSFDDTRAKALDVYRRFFR